MDRSTITLGRRVIPGNVRQIDSRSASGETGSARTAAGSTVKFHIVLENGRAAFAGIKVEKLVPPGPDGESQLIATPSDQPV